MPGSQSTDGTRYLLGCFWAQLGPEFCSLCNPTDTAKHWHVCLRVTYSAVPSSLLAYGPIHFGGTYVQGLVPLLHTSTLLSTSAINHPSIEKRIITSTNECR